VDKTDTSYHARSAVQMAANSCWCSIPIFCRLVEASQCIDKKDREAISLLLKRIDIFDTSGQLLERDEMTLCCHFELFVCLSVCLSLSVCLRLSVWATDFEMMVRLQENV
jgi:hypothetical protein